MKKIILLFILLLCTNINFADAAPQKLYQIDLVVFSHISNNALQSENWSNVLKIPDLRRSIELIAPTAGTTTVTPYQLLSADQTGLQDEVTKLIENSDYTVLLHISWQQPIDQIRQSKWIHIYGGQGYDANGQIISTAENNPSIKYWQLNGKIRISTNIYYNINNELYLTMPESILGNSETANAIGDFQPIPLISFSLNENRRTKLNELNYLDHPLFGALIKITAVKNATPTNTTT
ncbi:MAG: hypothetical protein A3C55_04700 [Gammaproteobacteria bacterium RIFCSPHIGHO2_02_FULL_42_13]|nr:MAG: hypothetical protein A3C55_04700 [Gammaproteobacteria bacterium RIFCSPHIGHO2_02_FULL_42_13]